MANIIIRGSRFVRGDSRSDTWSRRKDELYRRRKEIESDLKQTIFSKDKMDMRDCHGEHDEAKRTAEYDAWKAQKDSKGISNEKKMSDWSEINREFKRNEEEGRVHSIDNLRNTKSVKYD